MKLIKHYYKLNKQTCLVLLCHSDTALLTTEPGRDKDSSPQSQTKQKIWINGQKMNMTMMWSYTDFYCLYWFVTLRHKPIKALKRIFFIPVQSTSGHDDNPCTFYTFYTGLVFLTELFASSPSLCLCLCLSPLHNCSDCWDFL